MVDIWENQDNIVFESMNLRNSENFPMVQKAEKAALIRLRARGQLTLPSYIREKLHLEEGSLVLAKVVDQTIVLIPQETVDKEQSWFWQERWQTLEAEAEEDIRRGRVKSFDSVEELFNEIEESHKAYQNRKVQKKRS